MKRCVQDKWFWVALVLVAIIAGRALTSAFAQNAVWRGPTASPPGGQPSPPLDTSGLNQSKDGGLKVQEMIARDFVFVGANDRAGNGIRLEGGTGQILFDRTGLGAPGRAAISLRKDQRDNWVLQATHNDRIAGGWFDLGSGTGEGQWTSTARGITYSGGAVGIGSVPRQNLGLLQITGGGFREGLTFSPRSGSQYGRMWLSEDSRDFVIGRGGGGVPLIEALTIDWDGNVVFGGEVRFDNGVNGIRLDSFGRNRPPECNNSIRGLLWYQQRTGTETGKDTLSICIANIEGNCRSVPTPISKERYDEYRDSSEITVYKNCVEPEGRMSDEQRRNRTVCSYYEMVRSCSPVYTWKGIRLE